MKVAKIIWTNQAKDALKQIYSYYKEKSPQGAQNVKNDILKSAKTVIFSKQYQVDEINPNYRRVVVRDFKLLYKEEKDLVQIMDIVSTKQSPEILSKK